MFTLTLGTSDVREGLKRDKYGRWSGINGWSGRERVSVRKTQIEADKDRGTER